MCVTFIVIDSVTRVLLIEALYKFKTIKSGFTLYLDMYVLSWYKFIISDSRSCVSHPTDIYIVAIKNITNMNAVSTNHIADIFHFSNNRKSP